MPTTDYESSTSLDKQVVLNRVGVVSAEVHVELCRRSMSVLEIAQLKPGVVITFDSSITTSLKLKIGDRTIATGVPVRQDSQLGVAVMGFTD
ncbi:MAG: FliM/FliN family flagellar motor switch protein [Planctomycetes bacterium]|nr:FliM/FliN family flagellar motor switch protein [Planctomycetota bacterium]